MTSFLIFVGSLSLLVIFVISFYVAINLLSPKRTEVINNPSAYDLLYEDLSFHSAFDQTELIGWWIPAQNSCNLIDSTQTVIFAHGYGDSRGTTKVDMLNLAKALCVQGYNALLFDFRNSGNSAGKFNTVGVFERYDLHSAIELAKKRGSEEINLIGWSMGAATAILVGGENPYVSKVIADSPFSNLEAYLRANLPIWSRLPHHPFTPMILFIIQKVFRLNGDEVKPEEIVKQYKSASLFLIHGTGDTAVGHEHSERIYKNLQTRAHKEIWLPEGIRHIRAYQEMPLEYTNRVLQFLEN